MLTQLLQSDSHRSETLGDTLHDTYGFERKAEAPFEPESRRMKHLSHSEDHPQRDTDEICASLIFPPSANPDVGLSSGLVFGRCSLNKTPILGLILRTRD